MKNKSIKHIYFIAEYRKINGWTQKQLADLLGVSVSTIKNWENGRSQISDQHLTSCRNLFQVKRSVLAKVKD